MIAVTILVAFFILLITITIVGLYRNTDYMKDVTAVAAIFGGWIATVLAYYFGDQALTKEKKANEQAISTEKIKGQEKQKKIEELRSDIQAETQKKEEIQNVSMDDLLKQKTGALKKPVTIASDGRIGDAIELSIVEGFSKIPIVDGKTSKLLGVVRRNELIDYYYHKSRSRSADDKKGLENALDQLTNVAKVKEVIDNWKSKDKLSATIDSVLDESIQTYMKEQPKSTSDFIKVVMTSTIPAIIQQWATSKDDFVLLVDDEKDSVFKGILSRWDILKHYSDSLQI